nr:hypothetical protein [Pseudomonas sp. Irchel s3f10]
MSTDIESAHVTVHGVARLHHCQGHWPGDRPDQRADEALEITVGQLLEFKCLHRTAEKSAFGQRAKIIAVGVPEGRQLVVVPRAEVDVPEGVEYLVAVQATFIAVIEIFGVGAVGIETGIEIQQVSVVLIGGPKAMNHQLCEGYRFVGLFADVLPAGKRAGTALRRFESMEIDPVRVDPLQVLTLQQFAGDLMRLVVKARAHLNDCRSHGFERGFVCCIRQRALFGRFHAFSILEK